MVFGNGVKNIKAAAYNGVHTVFVLCNETHFSRYLAERRFLHRLGKELDHFGTSQL